MNTDNNISQWQSLKQQLADKGLEDFPEPASDAWPLHLELVEKLHEKINSTKSKSIEFSEYMQSALYEPGSGYYASGLRKFGADGDFVTAPELSPIFGSCIAVQIQQVFAELKNNSKTDLCILEFGPGSGALCVSVMQALEKNDSLPDSYYMMEVSPYLRQVQQEKINAEIPALASRVKWLDALPENLNGVVLANEVLDAMPIDRFRIGDDGTVESVGVALDEQGFVDKINPASVELKIAVNNIEETLGRKLTQAYSSEVNLWIEPWIKSLSETLQSGVVLLIDYGYPRSEHYHEQRMAGTLMCHYRQRAHEYPLLLTGLQDITAYVDFTAVAEAAINYDLSVAGFTNQAPFLMGCGLEHMLQLPDDGEPDMAYLKKVQQVKWLTLPSEMGDRFKVMALSKDIDQALLGFSFADFTHRL